MDRLVFVQNLPVWKKRSFHVWITAISRLMRTLAFGRFLYQLSQDTLPQLSTPLEDTALIVCPLSWRSQNVSQVAWLKQTSRGASQKLYQMFERTPKPSRPINAITITWASLAEGCSQPLWDEWAPFPSSCRLLLPIPWHCKTVNEWHHFSWCY